MLCYSANACFGILPVVHLTVKDFTGEPSWSPAILYICGKQHVILSPRCALNSSLTFHTQSQPRTLAGGLPHIRSYTCHFMSCPFASSFASCVPYFVPLAACILRGSMYERSLRTKPPPKNGVFYFGLLDKFSGFAIIDLRKIVAHPF